MKKNYILHNTFRKAVISMLAATTAFCFMVPEMTTQTYAKARRTTKKVRMVKNKRSAAKSAAPGVVSSVKFKDQDNGCTVITWKNASRAKKYKVYFKVDNASSWDTATETKDYPSEIVRTGYDHTLHIKVKAYNGSKAGKMSKTYSFHTKPLYDYAAGTPSTLTLKVGETKKITYKTVKGWNREDPLFDYVPGSNAESIAAVSEDGKVTGLSEGSFTVYNRASGKTPKVKVVVTNGASTNENNSSTNESGNSTSDSGKSTSGNSSSGNNSSGTVTPSDPANNSGSGSGSSTSGNTSGNSGSSSSNSGSGTVTPVNPGGSSSSSSSSSDSTDAKLKAKVQEIKAEMGITDSMSDLMKAKLAANWLCDHADYDHDYDSKTDAQMDTEVSYQYVLLTDEPKTVCSGYARAYNYILIQLGVPVRNIAYAAGDHEWNQIEVNGNWYNIDVTWMDLEPAGMHYRDFMKSYTAMVNQEGSSFKIKPHAYYDDPTLVQYRSDDTRYDNYIEEQWENYVG